MRHLLPMNELERAIVYFACAVAGALPCSGFAPATEAPIARAPTSAPTATVEVFRVMAGGPPLPSIDVDPYLSKPCAGSCSSGVTTSFRLLRPTACIGLEPALEHR